MFASDFDADQAEGLAVTVCNRSPRAVSDIEVAVYDPAAVVLARRAPHNVGGGGGNIVLSQPVRFTEFKTGYVRLRCMAMRWTYRGPWLGPEVVIAAAVPGVAAGHGCKQSPEAQQHQKGSHGNDVDQHQ